MSAYVELHRDIGLAYFVDKKTKALTGVIEIKRLDFDKVKADGIEIKEVS